MSTPIESALEALQIAFRTDPGAITHILHSTAVCSKAIEDHPTIPVNDDGDLTGLGLINGLLRAATGKVLAAQYQPGHEGSFSHLVGFSVYEEPVKLIAIPVLVYVKPGPDNPLTNEEFESRIQDALGDTPGVAAVFIAEDFATTEVEVDAYEDLSAMINAACEHSPGT